MKTHTRPRRPILFLSLALIALGAGSAPAQCQPDREDGGSLMLRDEAGCTVAPVLKTDIDISVSGTIARTRVTQRFHNPSDEWVEGTYVFPLPEGAAVDHLVMYVGDRVIEGRIQERQRARQTYEKARDRGVKASLVEQERPNVFQTSIANIGPDESIEIDIELQHLARYDNGEFRLRFPTVVASRFAAPISDEGVTTPAALESAADPIGSAIRAGDPINPVRLEVGLDAGVPLRAIYSPTHQIDSAEIDAAGHLITLRNDTFADRDFVLAWRPELGTSPTTAVFHEEVEGDVYALLMVLPPSEEEIAETIEREVVLVIDSSGSMGGNPIEQAKMSLLLALDELRPGDWFDVIDFDSEAHSLFGRSVAASADTIEEARAFVDGLSADGGTNIADALELALMPSGAPPEVRQVVFITDGAVGNEAEIFRQVADDLGDTRLFTVGIGSAPNSHFMRKAAYFGRGTYTTISTVEEMSERMDELFEKLESAAATDVDIDWNDLAGRPQTFPRVTPDLYRGEPLVVTARLAYLPETVEVTGKTGDQPWSATEELTPVLRPGTDKGIGRLWARQKIESLMDDLALGADRDEVREEVIELAMEHNLVSQYTSLVAIDVSATAPPGMARQRALPLNHPAGTLPRTATPAVLHALIALALSLFAALLYPRRSRTLTGTAG